MSAGIGCTVLFTVIWTSEMDDKIEIIRSMGFTHLARDVIVKVQRARPMIRMHMGRSFFLHWHLLLAGHACYGVVLSVCRRFKTATARLMLRSMSFSICRRQRTSQTPRSSRLPIVMLHGLMVMVVGRGALVVGKGAGL
jgi:hypothetical protein